MTPYITIQNTHKILEAGAKHSYFMTRMDEHPDYYEIAARDADGNLWIVCLHRTGRFGLYSGLLGYLNPTTPAWEIHLTLISKTVNGENPKLEWICAYQNMTSPDALMVVIKDGFEHILQTTV